MGNIRRNRPAALAAVRDPRRALAWWLTLAVTLAALVLASAAQARTAPQSFADLADKLLPAVVNISTTQVARTGSRRGPEMPQLPPGSPFEDFFKEFFDRQRPDGPPRRATSLGSGFIIDSSGYVVTNNHVVAEADEIKVILQDDTRLDAEIIGRDPKTDLALLKVKSKKRLPAVDWGNSDGLRVGDWVIAIGNPFGLGGTVTAGIVSARQRDIHSGPYDDFIQTDASINKGNSGGPLFNMKGQVVGVNSAIISPQGTSVGIGFSIPAALAKPVIRQLRDFGRTRRGWLGVRIQSVTEEIAESLGLGNERGALVANVSEGGPAAKAGVKQGDIILRFDGKSVNAMRRLPRIVAETAVGKKVGVVVWRKGKEVSLRVQLGELEEAEKAQKVSLGPAGESPGKGSQTAETLGLTLSSITDDVRRRFELGDNASGVVVTKVDASSSAGDKGIRPGDVIVEAGQDKVSKPEQIRAKVEDARKAGRKSVLLLVQRKDDLRFIALKVGES